MAHKHEGLSYAARLAACCLLLGLLPAWAEVQVIPQVADGEFTFEFQPGDEEEDRQ